jgi:hypothetical protein
MNPPPPLRKPKLHFDTAASPSHVTFDDGKRLRRNIPWSVYVEACWNHDETDLIRVVIGEWLVLLRGHNLGPLFVAIEEQTLVRVRAMPELEQERDRESDTFVSDLRFGRPPPKPLGGERLEQIEFHLPGS